MDRATAESRLGPYELFETLGRGAATIVRRARHVDHPDVDLALKVSVDVGPEASEPVATAFRREAALLASIGSAWLPTIHDVGTVDGRPYLAMEHIPGRSLAVVLRDGPMSEVALLALAADVADALAAIHQRGAVHRDIKPHNLLVTPSGRTRVIDVGLAAWSGAADTASDAMAGTFVYSAPEQTGMFARAVDGRADLYSLGVVLYECATGAPPFTAPDVAELLHQHASQLPADLGRLRPDLSTSLVDLVARLLAKDADDRLADAEALLAELRSLRGEIVVPVPARAAAPFGREAELHHLHSRWRRVERDGTFVLVSGELGSGSGTLLRTLAAEVRAGGGAAAVGRCRLDPSPLGPFRAALRSHLDAVAAAPDGARQAATERLRAAVDGTGSILRELVPSLAELLDPGAPVQRTGATREEDLVLAVVDLVRGLAREEGRFLLALTDTQWLDPLSLRVLRQLATTLRGTSLLLVVTARPDARDALAAILDEVDTDGSGTLDLGPLRPAAAAELVTTNLAGAAVPDELVASILTRTGRNPAAIAEYVRALVDAGAVHPRWGRWELDHGALERLQLPSDVRELLLTRLDRSDADVRQLLATAAVQGPSFEEDLLRRTTDRDPRDVAAAVAAALRARLIEVAGRGYTFVHEGVRLALLDGSGAQENAAIHAAIASALETTPGAHDGVRRIAHHRVAAGLERDPTAAYQACLRAAGEALDRRLATDAVALLEHARRAAELAAITPGADFEHTCGRAAFLTGAYTRAREHLHRAIAGSTGRLDRARALETLARIQASDHDADGALRTVRRGLDVLGRPLPRRRLVLVLTSLVRLLVGTVRLCSRRRPSTGERRVVDELEASLIAVAAGAAAGSLQNGLVAVFHARGLAPASRLPRCDVRSVSLAGLALVAHHVRLEGTARRLFGLARQEVTAVGSPHAIASVHTTEAVAATRDGDAAPLAAALEQHGRWLDIGEYVPWVILTAALYHGDGHALQAEAWVHRARRRVSEDPAPTDEAGTLLMGIAIAALRGRIALAASAYEALREARAMQPPTRDTQLYYAWTELILANEQEDSGAPIDHAMAQLDTFGLPTGNITAGWVRMSIATGLLNRAVQRDGAEQRALLRRVARVTRAARRGGGPHLHPMLDTVAARHALLRGRDRRAARLLERAAGAARQLDQPLVLHDVAVVRARVLRDTGYVSGARRQARVALALAVECGWDLRAERVRDEFDLEDEFVAGPRGSQPSTAGARHHLGDLQASRRLAALQEVSAAATSVLDPHQVAGLALDVVLRLLSAERAFLFTIDPDDGALVARGGRDADGRVLRELRGYSASLVERVHATGEAIIVTGTEDGEALGSRSTVVHGLRSVLIAPIEVGGRRSGLLYLDSRVAKGIFTADDLGLLTAVAGQVAAAQETARAAQLEVHVQAARRQRDLADRLRASMVHLAGTLDPDEVLRRGLGLVADACASERGCLLRAAPEGWRVVADAGRDAAGAVRVASTGTPTPVAGDVRSLLAHERPQAGAGSQPLPHELRRRLGDPSRWLVVPLRADDAWQGVIVVATSGAVADDEVAVEVAATLSEQTLAALQTAQLFAEVEHLATHDTLTGLANRGHFWQLAAEALASASPPGTAVMLDIDHFKAVNDTYGHAAGDVVLREVAARLQAVVGEPALLARFGGEEFAALLPGGTEGVAVAERMRAAVAAAPVGTGVGPVPITISVGCSRVAVDGGLDAALSRADDALYRSKRQGRDRVTVEDTHPGR